jgi:hypothetical protein
MFYTTVTNARVRNAKNKNNINKKRLLKLRPRSMLSAYHSQLSQYIYGILHPEQAVNSGNIPKAPNYVSIPTSNITFREAFDILPDKNGEFILYWTPNFLANNDTIKLRTANYFTDYSRNWLGGFDDTYNMFGYVPLGSYQPPASYKKYRLVSAGCRITYKGPTIERAGIISHCLSYRSIPVVFFKEGDREFLPDILFQEFAISNRLGTDLVNLDATAIQNGMWNSVQNVQKNQSVFVVAVPTDPSDFIFEDDGFFYQAATANDTCTRIIQDYTDGNNQQQTFACSPQLPQDGTPCSYIFKGTDLTVNAKLYVEQFYNFEVIPTEESAPILRPKRTNLSSFDLDKSKDVINKVLEDVSGKVASVTQNKIDQLLNMDSDFQNQINNEGSFTLPNFSQISQINNSKKSAQPKKKKQSFGQKVKNFAKDKVFTKDNAKLAIELLTAALSGMK